MSPLSQHASDQLAALLNGFGLAAKTPLSNWIDGDLVAGEGEEITLINPVVYQISGFRWSFYGQADVSLWLSLLATMIFLGGSLAVIHWIFKTGYRLKA